MNRREFLVRVPTATAGLVLFPWQFDVAAAGGSRWVGIILRSGASLAKRSLPGLVLSEIILGLLRAYDIDIAASVEGWARRSSRRQGGYWVSYSDSSGYIAKKGRCRLGGGCRVSIDGYRLSSNYSLDSIPTPGISLWAALRDNNNGSVCLHEQPCGYPVKNWTSRSTGDYGYFCQQYEGGRVELVQDATCQTIEDVYQRNKDEEVWKPARA